MRIHLGDKDKVIPEEGFRKPRTVKPRLAVPPNDDEYQVTEIVNEVNDKCQEDSESAHLNPPFVCQVVVEPNEHSSIAMRHEAEGPDVQISSSWNNSEQPQYIILTDSPLLQPTATPAAVVQHHESASRIYFSTIH